MYKHFIWDFDGTLFDTYPAMVSAFSQTLKEQGITEDEERILSLMKVSVSHMLDHYKSVYPIDKPFIDRFNQTRKQLELQLIKPYPHAKDICEKIVANGGYNYLYTHRGDSAITYLKDYDLYRYFTDFILKNKGFARKPSGEAILDLTSRHNMTKSEAIMIGDRDIDILAGKNAGIKSCYFDSDHRKGIDYANLYITSLDMLEGVIKG